VLLSTRQLSYYQIGDKDTLYAEVIHARYRLWLPRMSPGPIAAAPSPEEKLKSFISACVAGAIDKNPEIPPILWMREIASGGANMPRLVAVDIASSYHYSDGCSGGRCKKRRVHVKRFLTLSI